MNPFAAKRLSELPGKLMTEYQSRHGELKRAQSSAYRRTPPCDLPCPSRRRHYRAMQGMLVAGR